MQAVRIYLKHLGKGRIPMSAWFSILLLYTVLFSVANGVIKKSRLCIQYEIKDYKSSLARLKTLNGTSRGSCFMECVRQHFGCRAFQFHPKDGLCELLPEVKCMEEGTTAGTNLAGLSECKFLPFWLLTLPPNGNWRWVTDPPTLNKIIELVSRKGDAVEWIVHCTKDCICQDTSSIHASFQQDPMVPNSFANPKYSTWYYNWQPFRVGDAVPVSAIIGGYRLEGTPLYILKVLTGRVDTVYTLYYNARTLGCIQNLKTCMLKWRFS